MGVVTAFFFAAGISEAMPERPEPAGRAHYWNGLLSKVANRRLSMKIAQPFMAGKSQPKQIKSRQGRKNSVWM
jgi:hypothetical protein